MNNIVLGIILGFGVPALLGLGLVLFAKYFPKEKTFDEKIKPIFEKAAVVFFAFGSRWLKPVDFDKVEEGFLKTIAYWLDKGIEAFMNKLDELIENAKAGK